MKKPKERTWDVWGIFIDDDLQVILQPGQTKKDARVALLSDMEEIVKVRVTRL